MGGLDLQTGRWLDDEDVTIPAYLTETRRQYHPAVTPDLSGDAVAAGQGRTSQRIPGLAALLVVPVMVVVPGLLVRFGLVGDTWCILALFSPMFGWTVGSVLSEARDVELRDGHLLTARTLCGRRTVDLARLTKVRRIELRGRGRPADWLALKDVYGVRLILDEGHDVVVREAIVRTPAGQIAVSRRAAERLRLAPRSRTWQTYILAVLRTCALVCAVMVSSFIPLTVSLVIAGIA